MFLFSCSAFGTPSLQSSAVKHYEMDIDPWYMVLHCTAAPNVTKVTERMNVTSVSSMFYDIFANCSQS